MLCKCGFQNMEKSVFCSQCGSRLELKKRELKIPQIVTVKEAHELIFNNKLSVSKIYSMVREKSLPYVSAGGKILLDVEETVKWWNEKLSESTKSVNFKGLRKII